MFFQPALASKHLVFRKLPDTNKRDKEFVEVHKRLGANVWRYVANGANSKIVAKPRPTKRALKLNTRYTLLKASKGFSSEDLCNQMSI
ncbi:hypothetical protein MKX08_007763 [Trichoderma sp. CBMAI-0020]|nr:hypothetical protein MKX08_007763 [Trichoderma sp. CBMAI-0020]